MNKKYYIYIPEKFTYRVRGCLKLSSQIWPAYEMATPGFPSSPA